MKIASDSGRLIFTQGEVVRFAGGVAEVGDALGEHLVGTFPGVSVVGEVDAPENAGASAPDSSVGTTTADGQVSTPVGEPSGNASRGEWAKYAESLGIDPGDMKRDEIIAAVEAL